MMRLFSRRVSVELWKRSVSETRTLPPVLVSSPRDFNSGCLLRADATDKIDLDLWKSVMRSQRAVDESLVEVREEAKDRDSTGSPDDVLVATQELVSLWRQLGKAVPDKLTDQQVRSLAECNTISARKKYLRYLSIKENLKKKDKAKQEKKRSEREQSRASLPEPDQCRKNTFLLQFRKHWVDRQLGWRGVQAMRFGQPLVFDMSYEADMRPRELENAVSQLMEMEGYNRRSPDPFHLHMCNLQPGGAYHKELVKRYGAQAWDRLLITETPLHQVELFSREQLVYLTPDSPNVLRTFDPSKVYVVGALVDSSNQGGLSFANAKRLQLATARLPLDQFLLWEIGAKSLTLDQMIRILVTIKDTGSWEQALAFVPKRKHSGFSQTTQRDLGFNKSFRSSGGPSRAVARERR